MKSWFKYGFTLGLMMAGMTMFGQGIQDTVHQIHDVLVQDSKSIQTVEIVHDKTDNTLADFSRQEGRRFSDMLSDYSGIYLKNYGVGQLSSISINGSSAAQTDILWNGIKLNSPVTGQVDLSLFDISGGDKVSIYTTSQNRMTGSTGLGGTVALDNQLDLAGAKNIRSYDAIRIGSFGERTISSSNIYGTGGFKASTKLAFISADNDFPFVNDAKIGAPIVHETNAATKQISFTQQLQYDFKKPYTIGADLWITDADRQLPPVMTSDVSHEHEWDASYRVMAYVRGKKNSFSFSFKTAYLYDRLRYTDPGALIDSRSGATALRNVFTGSYDFGHNLFLNGELHYDHEMATSTGFDTSRHRNITGLNIALKYRHRSGLFLGVGAHQELLETQALPFSPSAFVGLLRSFHQENFLTVTLNGDRNYRLPALNDLYWNEGGNPNLRPEKAWKSSLHVYYDHGHWVQLIADGFYNYVTDWILWHPTPSGIWMPDNVKRVLSRGATVSLHMQSRRDISAKGFALSGYISYSYTSTTSLDAVSANDNSQGKQLIYVPLHNLSANIKVQYDHFYITSIHTYTSARYTTTDNSQSLSGYYLTHVEAGKDFHIDGQQICLSIRVNNIANTQYQAVADLPLPGRNYEATVRFNLAK